MSRIVIATTARFDLASGDRYIGEVQAIQGDLITLANYSAWYEGDTTPYDSKDVDETVRFRVDADTKVETFDEDPMDRHPARFTPGTRVVVIHPCSVHHAKVGTVSRGDNGRALVRFGTSRRTISFPNAQLCATTR